MIVAEGGAVEIDVHYMLYVKPLPKASREGMLAWVQHQLNAWDRKEIRLPESEVLHLQQWKASLLGSVPSLLGP